MNARVCSVADYFDAATSAHAGRARLSKAAAADEVAAHRDTWFHPAVVDAFLRAFSLNMFHMPQPQRG